MLFRIKPFTKFLRTHKPEGDKINKTAITNVELSKGMKLLTIKQVDGKAFIKFISECANEYGYTKLISKFPISMNPLSGAVGSELQLNPVAQQGSTINLICNYVRLNIHAGYTNARTYLGDGVSKLPIAGVLKFFRNKMSRSEM